MGGGYHLGADETSQLHPAHECLVRQDIRGSSNENNSCSTLHRPLSMLESQPLRQPLHHISIRPYAAIKNWIRQHLYQVHERTGTMAVHQVPPFI